MSEPQKEKPKEFAARETKNSPRGGTIQSKSDPICPKCGQAYDGERCWDCVSRKADIKETFSLCLPVALVGITFANLLVIVMFPPLISHFPWIYMIPALFVFGATIFVIVLGQRKMQYANAIRLAILLATISFCTPAVYFLLNGMMDASPSVEVRSRVVAKAIQRRGGRVLVVDAIWNHSRIEENVDVSKETYYAVEPGDTVRIIVHAGAFSQPWYENVLTSSGRVNEPMSDFEFPGATNLSGVLRLQVKSPFRQADVLSIRS